MTRNTTVLANVAEGIATITLNRPDVMNSFHQEMVDELIGVLEEIKRDSTVKTVVLTGSGKAFCAGGDLGYIRSIADPITARKFIASVGQIVTLIMTMEKPIIAMVNGVAAGAGFNIALACDIIFCGQSARFSQSFIKVGLIPDCGGLYLLPRIVGFHKAKELMFTADLIDSATALNLRIVKEVVGDAELKEVTYKFATRLAQSAPIALGLIKSMINRSDNLDLESTLASEANLQAICMQTEDHKEGVAAFKEKRTPFFTGK